MTKLPNLRSGRICLQFFRIFFSQSLFLFTIVISILLSLNKNPISTTGIRYKLHHFIETLDDERVAKLYSFLKNKLQDDESRRAMIKAERQKYIDGADKSYSWDEVKNMAQNIDQRNELQN